MNILDSTKVHDKVTIGPDTAFAVQGSIDKAFIILHSGMAEILYNEKPGTEDTPEMILGDSHRIGFIKGESLLGYLGVLRRDKPAATSVRAVTECVVSIRPMAFDELSKLIGRDKSMHMRIYRSLVGHVETSLELSRGYRNLRHRLSVIADSLALGCEVAASEARKGESRLPERTAGNFQAYAAALKVLAEEKGVTVREPWDHGVFKGDTQAALGLHEGEAGDGPDIDADQFAFFRHIIGRGEGAVAEALFGDGKANGYILDFLDTSVHRVLESNAEVAGDIRSLLELLYGEGGWVAQVRSFHMEGKIATANFLHFLARFTLNCRKDAINLLGFDPVADYPVMEGLKEFKAPARESEEKVTVASSSGAAAGVADVPGLEKYSGLLEKLLDFAGMNDEFRKEIIELANGFVEEPEVQGRYPRLSVLFWELYEEAFLKVVGTGMRSFIPGIMLHLGVMDERMLSADELRIIDEYYTSGVFGERTIPVMTLPFYLEKIYKAEIEPSMDEMGDVFATVMRMQAKMSDKEKEGLYLYQDSAEDKVRFELRQVSRELSGMLFGNRKKSLPFLTSLSLHGGAKRMFTDPSKVEEIVGKYMERDYSLFYREVLLKHEQGTDFVQKKVVPNLVLYPGYGTRLVMWQEMDGNKKSTAGRIFLPAFFAEKLEESLLQQIAYFRWELQKSISGHNWTDPVEGALVGTYYDYISFYKKNPDISSDAKKRLAEFVKKTKSDKDRFAHDYGFWVVSEFEGMVKLNPAARDIFYRFCPFPKTIREEMAKKPMYGNLEIKFTNRRNKELLKVKTKALKYEKANKPVPEELEAYIEFLQK